jgi:hypothetical protein
MQYPQDAEASLNGVAALYPTPKGGLTPMKNRVPDLRQTIVAALMVAVFFIPAFSQKNNGGMKVNDEIVPHYAVVPPHLSAAVPSEQNAAGLASTVPLTTWNGSFTSGSTTFTFNMVGTDPVTNVSTTIPVFIIPLKIVIKGLLGGTTTFDPQHVLSNGKTVIQNTLASPVFTNTTTFIQGGVNVGTTQYIDAYQRANFWGIVQNNPNYHLLLGTPTVLPEQTISVSFLNGTTGTPFGSTAGEVGINFFDNQVRSLITSFTQITPNSLPIFVTYDVYLTQNGSCCIGGYHSSTGSTSAPQAYAHFTYVDHPGEFAQDVSALSHEVGEWADDPLVVNTSGNNTPCGILENGDPLENNPNFGGFPYTSGGFTYNLQDLVTLPYFGAPPSTSVNNFFTFQGESLTMCQNGS